MSQSLNIKQATAQLLFAHIFPYFKYMHKTS